MTLDNHHPASASNPAAGAPATAGTTPSAPQHSSTTFRELVDELVLVFVFVMFLKTFLVEHYKIPTGSMTPTLLGGRVAYVTENDGAKKLYYWSESNKLPLVYVKRNGRYLLDESALRDEASRERANQLFESDLAREEYDHVLVSRLAYWFHNPRRGDIVVFKVPPSIYKPDAPIYIKRLVGEPGDVISFTLDGHLVANGNPVTHPDFFLTQRYLSVIGDQSPGFPQDADMKIRFLDSGAWKIDQIRVPKDQAYVFGDNSTPGGSWDSRYWGGVVIENFKGKAFLRVWPLSQFGFLK